MAEFEWDDDNQDHIARHGIEPREAEEAFADGYDYVMRAPDVYNEHRWRTVGRTDAGRVLFGGRYEAETAASASSPRAEPAGRNARTTAGREGDALKYPDQLIEIHSEAEIPPFTSEAEEAEFWATHSLGEELLAEFGPPDEELRALMEPTRLRPRLDDALSARIRLLASKREIEPDELVRQFICERLAEEEQREGAAG